MTSECIDFAIYVRSDEVVNAISLTKQEIFVLLYLYRHSPARFSDVMAALLGKHGHWGKQKDAVSEFESMEKRGLIEKAYTYTHETWMAEKKHLWAYSITQSGHDLVTEIMAAFRAKHPSLPKSAWL